jgi:hypothetical protein
MDGKAGQQGGICVAYPTFLKPLASFHKAQQAVFSVAIPALLSLVFCLPAFAQPAVLEQIDVISTRFGTELKLHADQPIKHRVLKSSDQRLVLELDGVAATRSVRTNFAQAKDIRHVIFQPNGSERLKVNISGKALGKPLVQVVYASPVAQPAVPSASAIEAAPVEPTQVASVEAASKPTSNNTATQTVKDEKITVVEPVSQVAMTPISEELPPEPVNEPAITEAIVPLPEENGFLSEEFTTSAVESTADIATDNAAPVAESPKLTDLLLGEVTASLAGAAGSTAFFPIGTIASLAGVLLLLAGLGLFIRHKWAAIAEQAGQFNGFAGIEAATSRSAQSPFKAMARKRQTQSRMAQAANEQLGMNKSMSVSSLNSSANEDVIDDGHEFAGHRHPKKANQWAERPKTNLHQPVRHAAQPKNQSSLNRAAMEAGMAKIANSRRQANNSTPPVEAALQQRAAKKPFSKQQSFTQDPVQPATFERLTRNEAGLGNPKARRTSRPAVGSDEERAQILKQRQQLMGQKPGASKPKTAIHRPANGEPLSGNPQVVDFLKDVASYMEQDGDKHRARQIAKSLRKFK